jgi:hypothetical protein
LLHLKLVNTLESRPESLDTTKIMKWMSSRWRKISILTQFAYTLHTRTTLMVTLIRLIKSVPFAKRKTFLFMWTCVWEDFWCLFWILKRIVKKVLNCPME